MSSKERQIKCVVWDLDGTLWDGILLEDDSIAIREQVFEVIRELDGRGILHSIASRNDFETAMAALRSRGLDEYFLVPQIGWGAKSDSVATIRERLNIGIDTIAFVDDRAFEREEVAFSHPEVLTVPASEVADLPRRPEFTPRFVTDDSRRRRHMYQSDLRRQEAEGDYSGPKTAFLETLGMKFDIFKASETDLQRAEELTIRTNQLNTTGITYSYDQLSQLIASDDHLVLVAQLADRFGFYGKIGLAVVDKTSGTPDGKSVWHLNLLLMSCRVMATGVGSVLLSHIRRLARLSESELLVSFRPTSRNRMMYMTLRFAGFEEVKEFAATSAEASDTPLTVLRDTADVIPDDPPYIEVQLDPSVG